MPDAGDIFEKLQLATEFTVTSDHLKLLRGAAVSWGYAEFGAPRIDPKKPYGNSDVMRDIAGILGVPEGEWSSGDGEAKPGFEERAARLHAETGVALEIALETGELREGTYVRSHFAQDWTRAE